MHTRQRTIAAILAMAGMLAATPPALAQWQGQAVTVDRRYPDANTVKMNLGTKTISAKGMNYFAGKVTVQVFPAQVRIMLSPLGGPTPFRADTFNGFQITGAGTLPPVIGAVTINPQTHLSGFDSTG
jgi:hypothetical protein